MALAKPLAHFTLRLRPSHSQSQQNDSGSDLETRKKYHPKVYRDNCHSQLQPLASADYNMNDGCKKVQRSHGKHSTATKATVVKAITE